MHRHLGVVGRLRLSVAILLAAATIGVCRAAVPVGSELQVNTYTSSQQRHPAVAMDLDGDFVAVWDSAGQDGSLRGLFARRFSSSGAARGGEFQVNTYTSDDQIRPAVAMDAGGDFVVAWQSALQDGSGHGVFARRFSSAGAAIGGEFQVNTYTSSEQTYAVVAMDDDGDFVVVWQSPQDDGGDSGVFGRRFSSSGTPLASEFLVNTYTPDLQTEAAVAMDADGDFVVVWESQHQDGNPGRGVFARRFSSAGASLDEFQVNSYTTDSQAYPTVAMDEDGDFVVAWQSIAQDGDGEGVFAQRFTSPGVAVGSEFQVDTHTTGSQDQVSAAMDAHGDFVMTWRSDQVRARLFSSSGAPVGGALQVNSYTIAGGSYPAAAMEAGGDFVISWEDPLQEGSYGIFARRFIELPTLDLDGDGSVEPLTDGLLVLRFGFGFTGATLVSGAIDLAHCTRCEATAIAGYLSAIEAQLDVDGDGSTEPLTDGLLVLRFSFGFTGATLVSGAVDLMDCTRCDAAEIEPYLQSLSA